MPFFIIYWSINVFNFSLHCIDKFESFSMVTIRASSVAEMFWYYYHVVFFSNYQFSRKLDNLLNFDSPYFEQMESQIYPTKLQLNNANYFDTVTPFWISTCKLRATVKATRRLKSIYWSILYH